MYRVIGGDVISRRHMAENRMARDAISCNELCKSIARMLNFVWLIGQESVSFKRHDLCSTRNISRSTSRPIAI